jgi:hypothetical protein
MANAQVVCVSSREPRESYYRLDCFLASLKRYAEEPTILGTESRWDGLMTKPFLYRDWLRVGNNTSDRIILCDAWDILFVKHPHDVGDRCIEHFGEDAIVFNGERNIWPRGDLKEEFPDTGPWRFLNSGFMCGSAANILALLESMDLESIGVDRIDPDGTRKEPNDQGEFQQAYVNQSNLRNHRGPGRPPSTPRGLNMVVDGMCKVAMTLSACEQDDYEFGGVDTGRYVKNCVTGTMPGVIHANGDGMNKHFQRFLDHWELS